MIKAALAPTATREEVWDYICCKITECRDGISDAEPECLRLAEIWYFDKAKFVESFRQAREVHEAELKKRQPSSLKQRLNASMQSGEAAAQSQVALGVARPEARAPAKATEAAVVLKQGVASPPASAPAAAEPKRQLVRLWSEVVIPHGANEREKLTYVPGLVGDIVEWIVAGARRPNRMLALGVASVVIGTLIGRRIEGPTGSATHLFIILLAPTGYGKDHPLQAGPAVMEAAGRSDLLGPHGWASAPGFEKRLSRNPLMACFVDELGDELAKIKDGGGPWLTATIGLLKRCYNAWGSDITAEKVKEESQRIDWPAPSIVGAATPERFFENLQPGDLESGFANRLLILPFEGCRRPPEQSSAAKPPPKELIAALTHIASE